MEQIVLNLKNPEWWFTGIFFLCLSIFLPKLFFKIWKKVVYINTSLFQQIAKKKKINILRKVKRYRQYSSWVNWSIVKYWSLSSAELMLYFFVAFLYVTSDNKFPVFLFVIILNIFSILMFRLKTEAREIMKAHEKWNRKEKYIFQLW